MHRLRLEIRQGGPALLQEEEVMELARDLARLILTILKAESNGEREAPQEPKDTEAA